ncbi:DMT family transporter [Vibrio maerlii]|uniref:DMT family transporter n=1 Tax=Vibrio maerlii TaxID=2231648 RepID=UPI000E3C5080|nr:DMT family transporter [Vibrio maerlii]
MSAQSFAILLLIVGNLAASLSDVAVKLLNGEVSSFQYVFIRQLLSTAVLLPFWFKQSKEKRALVARGLTIARAQLVLIGSGCMLVAITHLPLATANAVFYAAPLLMLPLSILLLKETPSLSKVFASIIGFCGVLVVLRPSEFHWAAIFALGTASTIALFNVTARRLPAEQPIISTLFWTSLLSLPVASVLALATWQPLSSEALILILGSAALILGYNGLAIAAYRRAPAGNIAVAENSGLLFVTLFGVMWFSEVPDWLTGIGIVMIIVPLLPWRKLKRG